MAIIKEDKWVQSNYEFIISFRLQSYLIAIEWQHCTDIKTGVEMDAIGETYTIKWLSHARSGTQPVRRGVSFNFSFEFWNIFALSFIH